MSKLNGMARREPPPLFLQGTKSGQRVAVAPLLGGLGPHNGVNVVAFGENTWGVMYYAFVADVKRKSPRAAFSGCEDFITFETCPPVSEVEFELNEVSAHCQKTLGGYVH
jgi:hypothetical protein